MPDARLWKLLSESGFCFVPFHYVHFTHMCTQKMGFRDWSELAPKTLDTRADMCYTVGVKGNGLADTELSQNGGETRAGNRRRAQGTQTRASGVGIAKTPLGTLARKLADEREH